MIKLIIELLDFLRTCAPLLTSLAILTLFCVVLSKSIRRYSTIYYIIFAIPFMLVALPSLARLLGIEMPGLAGIPFLGEVVRDYIHMGTFGHPLLIIIMYIGALNPKIAGVKKLAGIRKELSIICGFPVLAHSLIRVVNNLMPSFQFFSDKEGYMANTRVASEWGAGISSFSFILGIIMLVIFIPLWVTSFDWVRKQMQYKAWKKVQKWAYVLYVTLFIHAMGIQIGGMLNPREGHARQPAVETVAQTSGGRVPTFGFANISVAPRTKQYIHLTSLLLIYGSYLCLRIRKAKRSTKKVC
ncbi:MAG: ferric reductase-like transmembrane domain-containing protein [Tannerellaceae bacterium]|jgi:DMSO/TMAO reductase YedYZ heme-binding membrane subunit|nr:ferric reductase-like transmembrane domain-containing protein [Tannerellaceae bacterium]